MNPSQPINALIVDDHKLFAQSLCSLLKTNGLNASCVYSGEEALAQIDRHTPDLVLCDIKMSGISGIETSRQILKNHPQVRIIFLTMYENRFLIQKCLKAGAHGYLLKNASDVDMMKAIEAAMLGKTYIKTQAEQGGFEAIKPDSEKDTHLSDREQSVLMLMAEGLGNADIGKRLFISPKTVDAHKANIKRKLGIKTNFELTIYALKLLHDLYPIE